MPPWYKVLAASELQFLWILQFEVCQVRPHNPLMRAVDIQHIGRELAIKWEDGREDFIPLERLRRCCPCAGCSGETDLLGNVYKNPAKPFSSVAFKLVRLDYVGGYAIQPVWADGHNTGIFSFEYLKKVAATPEG
jgi:DUF971 family protein